MTEEQIALAKRAVACNGWRFMGGMLVSDAIGKQRIYDDVAGEPYWSTDGWLPDLTDPATQGCLLALVREALNVPTAHVLPSFGAWYIERDAQDGSEDSEWLHVDGVWGCGSAAIIEAKAEAEALVAALEAAP